MLFTHTHKFTHTHTHTHTQVATMQLADLGVHLNISNFDADCIYTPFCSELEHTTNYRNDPLHLQTTTTANGCISDNGWIKQAQMMFMLEVMNPEGINELGLEATRHMRLVFWSPVQSGFFPFWVWTGTMTGSDIFTDYKKPDWTAHNRLCVVRSG